MIVAWLPRFSILDFTFFQNSCPVGLIRFERNPLAREWMRQGDPLSQQTEWRRFNTVCLGITKDSAGEVGLISTDRPPQVPQVDTDLIRSTGQWNDFEQGSSVIEPLQDSKLCVSSQPTFGDDIA